MATIHVTNTCAETLLDAILAALQNWNLNINNLRGQAYDGASNMRGEFNSLQALIQQLNPSA